MRSRRRLRRTIATLAKSPAGSVRTVLTELRQASDCGVPTCLAQTATRAQDLTIRRLASRLGRGAFGFNATANRPLTYAAARPKSNRTIVLVRYLLSVAQSETRTCRDIISFCMGRMESMTIVSGCICRIMIPHAPTRNGSSPS